MIHLDFETRSELNIWEVGAWAYSCHPSTEILCAAYAVDDGPILVIPKEQIRVLGQALPRPGAIFGAYNAFFEQAIWANIGVKRYGWPRIPIKQWRCVMAKSLARALPRSLEGVGSALNLEQQKDKTGYQTMLKLCTPNKKLSQEAGRTIWNDDPRDLEILYNYCIQDVETERAVDNVLPDLTAQEQIYWFHDQLINSRGVYVDVKAIERSLEVIDLYSRNLTALVADVSQGALDKVSRRGAVLQWCADQGVNLDGYTKQDVKKALEKELPERVRRILETRVQLGKTSTSKYIAMKNSVGEDNRVRDLLIYHGASTGRWAGKLIQLHNLPKPKKGFVMDMACKDLLRYDLDTFEAFYPDVMGTLSSCIRGMIIAPPGHTLAVADYNAIEARVLFWLSDEEYGINQFKNGEPIYENMANLIYDRKDITKGMQERELGKKCVLGCGYGLGYIRFVDSCAEEGLIISDALGQKAIDTYRKTYRSVTQFWYDAERSAINTVRTGGHTVCGKISWHMDGDTLLCRLPSGRDLAYNNAEIRTEIKKWKKKDANGKIYYEEGDAKDTLTHMSLRKVEGATTTKWDRVSTYGGKLVENITQAVARDILASAIFRAEKAGFSIALHVHDEAVAEVKDRNLLGAFEKLLEVVPTWAQGCPVKVEGFCTERYRK